MTTDLERLKAWMQQEEMKPARLSRLLKLSPSFISLMLNDKRHISASLEVKFYARFGSDVAQSIFKDPLRPRRPTHHNSEKLTNPDRYAAHQAVANAVRKGEMQPAKFYKCHACPEQAQGYHHPSYLPADHLCVVPLCRKCHRAADRGKLDIPLGVVPTRVGLVRIAIATPTGAA